MQEYAVEFSGQLNIIANNEKEAKQWAQALLETWGRQQKALAWVDCDHAEVME